jgi:nucleoside-diphosphate-sugar epimerase
MEVVGRGFIAGSLAAIADRHPAATVLAAGVSSTSVQAAGEFAREAALVRDTAARCRRDGRTVVFLSSASHAMYGTTDIAAGEDTAVAPTSPYGRHKRALEHTIATSGAPWLILRLSHVTGPGQRDHQLLPAIAGQVLGGSVRLYRGVHRDLVDVADVVRAIDGLLGQGMHGEVVNVASGTPHPIEVIVRGIERRLAASPRHEGVDATPTMTRVSVDKLCALLPPMASVTEPGYLDLILDRYVACYAARAS